MQKLLLSITFIVAFSVVSLANSGKPNSFLNKQKKERTASIQQKPWEWSCYDVTFYLTCGSNWSGDVCVWTNLPFLTDGQFITAWRHKNMSVCGSVPVE